jgi:predicted dienelactone hydrolase
MNMPHTAHFQMGHDRMGHRHTALRLTLCGLLLCAGGARALAQAIHTQAAQAQPSPSHAAQAGDSSQATEPETAKAPWQLSPFANPGSLSVGEVRTTLRDEDRTKDLHIALRWPSLPKAPASDPALASSRTAMPLVVFSHGMGGDREAFGTLSAHLASHGFVVVHVTHSDSIKLRREQGETITPRNARDVRNVDPADRLADVVFLAKHPQLLEMLIAQQEKTDTPALTIDPARVAIAGHSAGALTTMLAINVKARMREPNARARDMLARIERGDEVFKAGVVISGQGTTNRMLGEDSWNELRVPMLVLAGSEDVAGVGNETPQSRRHPFEKSMGEAQGGPPVALVWIEGATHGSYQGKDLARQLREEPSVDAEMVAAITRASMLAFLLAWSEGTLRGMHEPAAKPAAHNAQSPAPASAHTLHTQAPHVLHDATWLPSLSDEKATLQWK